MVLAARLVTGFTLATLVAFLCAAAVIRALPASPKDAMAAAGMLLMFAWPLLVIAAVMPARARTGWAIVVAIGLAALLIGWVLA